MMISRKSKLYAEALFSCIKDEIVLNQMESFQESLKDSKILDFFKTPLISKEDKKSAIKPVVEKFSKILKNFFFVLIDNQMLLHLDEIKEAYNNLINSEKGFMQAQLHYSSLPNLETEKKLKNHLEKLFQKKVFLKKEEDKNLSGGFYIKTQDYIFDNSIDFHLKKFQTEKG